MKNNLLAKIMKIKNKDNLIKENTKVMSGVFYQCIREKDYSILKFLSFGIQGELNAKAFYNDRQYDNYIAYVKNSFILDMPLDSIKSTKKIVDIKMTPVISTVWNINSLEKCYLAISSYADNPFNLNESKNNVQAILIQPIGLVIVYAGNHSINSAIIHNEGEFYVNQEIDITPVLRKYAFDGENYISIETGGKVNISGLLNNSEPFTYTIGIFYEIARKMLFTNFMYNKNVSCERSNMNNKVLILVNKFRYAIDKLVQEGCLSGDVAFNDFPRGCCGDASALLARYLLEHNVKTYYISAERGVEGNWESHAWLSTSNPYFQDDYLLIDITIDQYKDNNSSIYVGANDEFHKLFEIVKVIESDKTEFNNIFDWRLRAIYNRIIKIL